MTTRPDAGAGWSGLEDAHPGGDLGWRIRSRREALGMDRAELALRSGVDPQYLEFIEEHAAEPDALTVAALARALGTSREALRGADGRGPVEPGDQRAP